LPQAPAADQRRLLDVQDADTSIAQARHRRDNLPVLAQLAELAGRAEDLERARGAAAIEASDIQREVTKAEDDVRAVRARAERDTARLHSGEGTPKELQALQAELELLAKRQSDLEDIELEAMERLEDAQSRAAAAEQQAAAIREQVAQLEAERDAEWSVIDRELAELSSAREAASAGLDSGLVTLYERLRATGGGVGAARLLRGQCQGCHMTLNPVDLNRIMAAGPDDIVRCEECGRILVRGASE
jgi:predicted  nucleic acid-binding Zn-ribbon protein